MTSNYWLQDAQGRVLGPVGMAVLRDLVSNGRIKDVSRVSRDGRDWYPLAQVREIHELFQTSSKHQDELAEARRLRQLIEDYRTRPPSEIFGLELNADLETHRQAFFRLVKQYHPDRLPADAHADLRHAYLEIFHFLAATMAKAEADILRMQKPAPPPRVSEPTPKPKPIVQPVGQVLPAKKPPVGGVGADFVNAPTGTFKSASKGYKPEEFVGLQRREDGRIEANIRVTLENAGMFTDHKLVNLSKGGVFLAMSQRLALGTNVEVIFHFDNPQREVKARGKVIWESGGKESGIGIKFTMLTEADQQFLQSYVDMRSRALEER